MVGPANKSNCIIFCFILILLGWSTSTVAYQAQDEVRVATANSASELDLLRRALENPDPSIRYTAFVQAIESNRIEYRELAISIGFASSDQVMQQLAVRAAFKGVQVLAPIIVETRGQPLRPEDVVRLKNDIILTVNAYDWQTGTINSPSQNTYSSQNKYGQVSSNIISYATHHCATTLARKEHTWEFVGQSVCQFNNREIHFSVTYQMR